MPEPATPTLDQLFTLITELMLPFHEIQRDIDLPLASPRAENDVEHSWSVTLMACALAPAVDPALDVGKIAQFAIVHDLVEVFAGDTSIFAHQSEHDSKAKRERQALDTIHQRFAAFPWLATTITEYEQKSTPEAKFVSAIDKLLALQIDYLDKGSYLGRKRITESKYFKSLERPTQKGHLHPAVGDYYDQVLELIKTDPDFFAPA